MSQRSCLVPMSPAERIALRSARRAALRGTIAFAAATTLAMAALAGSLLERDPIGVLPFVALLGAGWAWWLRGMPRRLLAATGDLQRDQVEVVSGSAALRQRRGVGLLAPMHPELLLDGRRYGLAPRQTAQLREDLPVEAHVAPASGVLLSITPILRAPATSPVMSVNPTAAAAQGLTPRETDLLRLIAAGHTDKGIARELGLEPATVRTYNSQLYAKLGVRRRTEAMARAHALGLVTNVDD